MQSGLVLSPQLLHRRFLMPLHPMILRLPPPPQPPTLNGGRASGQSGDCSSHHRCCGAATSPLTIRLAMNGMIAIASE